MFTIGKASEQSGVNIETIRYYEREGVVPKAGALRRWASAILVR